MLPYIDSHAHVSMLTQGKPEGWDTHRFLQTLFADGFGGIIDIGTEADDLYERVKEFSSYPLIRFTAGIWPSQEAIHQRWELVATLEGALNGADPKKVVALGECGLDRHWNQEEKLLRGEEELLELQLELAIKYKLPIIIHSRDAAEATAAILAQFPKLSGVIHCYSYTKDEARTFLDLGYHISFSGNLTYKKSQGLREALGYVPDDRILLETDSPYLAPMPFRGKAADPGMVAETYAYAARMRGVDEQFLVDTVRKNVVKLFGFPIQSL